MWVPNPAEYVALGAARQAAWTLSGEPEPPTWHLEGRTVLPDRPYVEAGHRARERYRDVLASARSLLDGEGNPG